MYEAVQAGAPLSRTPATPVNPSPISARLCSIRQALSAMSRDLQDFENRLNGKPQQEQGPGDNKLGEYAPMPIEDVLAGIEQHLHDIHMFYERLSGRF